MHVCIILIIFFFLLLVKNWHSKAVLTLFYPALSVQIPLDNAVHTGYTDLQDQYHLPCKQSPRHALHPSRHRHHSAGLSILLNVDLRQLISSACCWFKISTCFKLPPNSPSSVHAISCSPSTTTRDALHSKNISFPSTSFCRSPRMICCISGGPVLMAS